MANQPTNQPASADMAVQPDGPHPCGRTDGQRLTVVHYALQGILAWLHRHWGKYSAYDLINRYRDASETQRYSHMTYMIVG